MSRRCPLCGAEQPEDAVDRLVAAITPLLEQMARNERDRELSPYWRHPDGTMVTRAEWEAIERREPHPAPFEGAR